MKFFHQQLLLQPLQLEQVLRMNLNVEFRILKSSHLRVHLMKTKDCLECFQRVVENEIVETDQVMIVMTVHLLIDLEESLGVPHQVFQVVCSQASQCLYELHFLSYLVALCSALGSTLYHYCYHHFIRNLGIFQFHYQLPPLVLL